MKTPQQHHLDWVQCTENIIRFDIKIKKMKENYPIEQKNALKKIEKLNKDILKILDNEFYPHSGLIKEA